MIGDYLDGGEIKPLVTVSIGEKVIAQGLAKATRPDLQSTGALAFGFVLKLTSFDDAITNSNALEIISNFQVVAEYKGRREKLKVYQPIALALQYFLFNPQYTPSNLRAVVSVEEVFRHEGQEVFSHKLRFFLSFVSPRCAHFWPSWLMISNYGFRIGRGLEQSRFTNAIAFLEQTRSLGAEITTEELSRIEALGDNCDIGFVLRPFDDNKGRLFRWSL